MSLKPIFKKLIEDDKYYYYEERGERGCMCPKCKYITFIDINDEFKVEINTNDLLPPDHTIVCCKCGNQFINNIFDMLDPNIAETISLFNRAGIETLYCCEGHEEIGTYGTNYSWAYISFKDEFEEINQPQSIPKNWFVEKNIRIFPNLGITSDILLYYNYYNNDEEFNYGKYNKEEEMKELYNFALSIYKNRMEEI